MTDWRRVIAFEKHTYVQSFPITSFLLAGVSYYKDTIKGIQKDEILTMKLEPNQYDSAAIVIKQGENTCGYVPRDMQSKVRPYVPSNVKVIDKRLVENNIYSLRVDIVKHADIPIAAPQSKAAQDPAPA